MKKEESQLSGRQRKYLRSLGHHLTGSVIVGREGITENLIQTCEDGLKAHELIKVKLGQNCPLEKKQAAQELAAATQSHLVQLIGKTVLLYKPNPQLPKEKTIVLPR